MQLNEVMQELEALGNAQTVQTYCRHGAEGPMFGVKVGDLKKLLRKIKGDQALAMELWDTGNADAMYLAALVADGSQMTKTQLNHWCKTAWWHMLSGYAVPFVAAEHRDARGIALKWMKAKQEDIATSGWATYALLLSVRPDEGLDKDEIQALLNTVESTIHAAPNRVRYNMNNFVISVGAYYKPLLRAAKATAKRIGKVEVDMGDTACKVPLATESIAKIESMGRVGKKRSSTKG